MNKNLVNKISRKRVDEFTTFYPRKKQSKRRFDNISRPIKIKNNIKAFARKKSLIYAFTKALNPHLAHWFLKSFNQKIKGR